jgi:hypothetical protein
VVKVSDFGWVPDHDRIERDNAIQGMLSRNTYLSCLTNRVFAGESARLAMNHAIHTQLALRRPGPATLKLLQPSYLASYIGPADEQSLAAQAISPSRLKGMVRFSLGFMYYKFSVVAYKQGIFVKL